MIRLGRNPKAAGTGLRPAPTVWRAARDARGAVQLEFALTIIVVFFVMFWMWELVLLTYTMNVLGDAAKEGVRTGIVQGASSGTCPTAAITSRVQTFAAMSLHSTSGMTVNVTYPDGGSAPCSATNRVRVDVYYPYIPYIRLPMLNPTLHTAAEGRIVFNRS
jgi:Flp pilus assembly protein TadG